MNKVPTESLIRLLECQYSNEVPAHWIRLMAAEILQARGEYEPVRYEKAFNEIKKKLEGVKGG